MQFHLCPSQGLNQESSMQSTFWESEECYDRTFHVYEIYGTDFTYGTTDIVTFWESEECYDRTFHVYEIYGTDFTYGTTDIVTLPF
jgi:hypothetical protein